MYACTFTSFLRPPNLEKSNTSLTTLGRMPSLSGEPRMVCVFPEPVCPYAKKQTLKPSMLICSNSFASSYTCSCVVSPENTASYSNFLSVVSLADPRPCVSSSMVNSSAMFRATSTSAPPPEVPANLAGRTRAHTRMLPFSARSSFIAFFRKTDSFFSSSPCRCAFFSSASILSWNADACAICACICSILRSVAATWDSASISFTSSSCFSVTAWRSFLSTSAFWVASSCASCCARCAAALAAAAFSLSSAEAVALAASAASSACSVADAAFIICAWAFSLAVARSSSSLELACSSARMRSAASSTFFSDTDSA
mmetsp:Transcript_13283/g.25468  ORF Transcript_13283/g.25468 Transcript_13283/m.25468 type:complete len:314 (-) Transcript_13283:1367-2308(-)